MRTRWALSRSDIFLGNHGMSPKSAEKYKKNKNFSGLDDFKLILWKSKWIEYFSIKIYRNCDKPKLADMESGVCGGMSFSASMGRERLMEATSLRSMDTSCSMRRSSHSTSTRISYFSSLVDLFSFGRDSMCTTLTPRSSNTCSALASPPTWLLSEKTTELRCTPSACRSNFSGGGCALLRGPPPYTNEYKLKF